MAQYRTATAAALDAADGVIDGKYFGRPIIETSGLSTSVNRRYYGNGYTGYVSPSYAPSYGGTYGGYSSYSGSRVLPYVSSTAAALDAADGVIDGKYFGRPIVETTGYSRSVVPSAGYPIYRSGYTVPSASVTRVGVRRPYYEERYGRRYYDEGYRAGSVTRYAPRYDGYRSASVTRYAPRYDGYRAASVTRVAPRYDGYQTASVTRYGARAYDDYSSRYLDGSYYGGYSRPATSYRTSTALALDAADGVIDGKYFGRPIVETAPVAPVRRYVGNSLAERLDAADGVMDGKYFGRPIVTI